MHTIYLHASNPHLWGNCVQGHRSRSRSLQKSQKTVYPLKCLFINRFTKTKCIPFPSTPAIRTSEEIVLKVIVRGEGLFKNCKSQKTVYPLKFLFINWFTKNKMHTISLHASNPHLRGNCVQGHRTRSRSLQKISKTVYRLKFSIINRFTKTKCIPFPSTPAIRTSEEIALKVIGQVQCHFKNRKNGVPSKFFIYQPIHEKQNAYHLPPRQQSAPLRKLCSRS